VFVEEVQNTFVRDDHSNMVIACAGKEGDPGGFNAMFPDLADTRASRRPSRDMGRRPSIAEVQRRDSITTELARLKSIALYQTGAAGASIFSMAGMDTHTAKQEIMNFTKVTVWAEYFNNMRKCWEPLLEKLVATVLYEKVCLCSNSLFCAVVCSLLSGSIVLRVKHCAYLLICLCCFFCFSQYSAAPD
jgi:hypothetical protein